MSLEIELLSDCDVPLERTGLRPTLICYRWLSADSSHRIEAEGHRTELSLDVLPGTVHRMWLTISAPSNFVGPAILRIVPVQEQVGWFDDVGGFYCDVPVAIEF